MKIVIAGEDLTNEVVIRIKENLFQHLALQNRSSEELNSIELPDEWKKEYFHTVIASNNLFQKIGSSLYFRKFDNNLRLIPKSLRATKLLHSPSEVEFLSSYLKMTRDREHIDACPFYIPYKKTIIGALIQKIKILCWHFLRFIVDRIAFRQNLINSYLSSAIEFQNKFTIEEIEKLKERVKQLEEKHKI